MAADQKDSKDQIAGDQKDSKDQERPFPETGIRASLFRLGGGRHSVLARMSAIEQSEAARIYVGQAIQLLVVAVIGALGVAHLLHTTGLHLIPAMGAGIVMGLMVGTFDYLVLTSIKRGKSFKETLSNVIPRLLFTIGIGGLVAVLGIMALEDSAVSTQAAYMATERKEGDLAALNASNLNLQLEERKQEVATLTQRIQTPTAGSYMSVPEFKSLQAEVNQLEQRHHRLDAIADREYYEGAGSRGPGAGPAYATKRANADTAKHAAEEARSKLDQLEERLSASESKAERVVTGGLSGELNSARSDLVRLGREYQLEVARIESLYVGEPGPVAKFGGLISLMRRDFEYIVAMIGALLVALLIDSSIALWKTFSLLGDESDYELAERQKRKEFTADLELENEILRLKTETAMTEAQSKSRAAQSAIEADDRSEKRIQERLIQKRERFVERKRNEILDERLREWEAEADANARDLMASKNGASNQSTHRQTI